MPNLAGVLKEEIRRLARKEIKSELAATKKASGQHRRDIAALKRQLQDQERKISSLERTRKAETTGPKNKSSSVRFSPAWLQAHRKRLALSAVEYAALVGVSALTIYNWEKGKTRPGQQQLQAWGAIRGLGKREAWRRLEEME